MRVRARLPSRIRRIFRARHNVGEAASSWQPIIVVACLLPACGSGAANDSTPASGGMGGVLSGGGNFSTGGTVPFPGSSGVPGAAGGFLGSGGTSGTGGAAASGGSGGASTLDAGSGPGGSFGTGGAGGSGTGGVAAGGAGNGGSAACDLPTSFHWSSSGPLVSPKSSGGHDFVSIKDPTIVLHDGTYHVFSTVYDTAPSSKGWKSVYLNLTDLSQADAAPQSYMGTWTTGSTVAPEVFYFQPQNKWYLIFQWGARYSTNDDIDNPNGWTAPKSLLAGEPNGALDYFPICDDTNCYLFFSADNGKLYRSKTSIQNFPAFSGYDVVMSDPQSGRLFEASSVYKVQGKNEYLLLVEAYGPRYFRSWTAPSLDGPWTPLADSQAAPFAGEANVTFQGAAWTKDISHGELLRVTFDQTQTIDACRLQFLYQGVNPNSGVSDYGLLPYRLGLLTATH